MPNGSAGLIAFYAQNHIGARECAARHAVPFPGMGQQARFGAAMKTILPPLPKLSQ
jgi:hypothetical protein